MFLLFHFSPLISIRRAVLLLDDRLPDLGELGVQRGIFLLVIRHVVFRVNRLDRAFGDA